MPYRSIADLPPRIREYRPPHAQEIFLEAFKRCPGRSTRCRRAVTPARRETARVAWGAVKRQYVKARDRWVRR
jgi:cation transport regulator